jgi:pyruvate formate lyase activating enzyme
MIPTKNDEWPVVKEMCLWIKKELGADIPVHFSRFYPLYKLRSLPPTPVSTLEKARNTALSSGLEYVYIGNIPGHEGEHTFCPKCKKKFAVILSIKDHEGGKAEVPKPRMLCHLLG